MDNPNLVHLIPSALQNKKEVLFGNLPEIYYFHNRYMGTGGFPASLGATIMSSPFLSGVLSCSHIHWQEKSSSLGLCVCPIKLMCREHLQDHLFHIFLLKIVPFVHLLVISPGRIHFKCPLWSVFYRLSWYTGRCHRTKSCYFLSGKAPLWGSFLSVQLICPVFLLSDQKTLYIWYHFSFYSSYKITNLSRSYVHTMDKEIQSP